MAQVPGAGRVGVVTLPRFRRIPRMVLALGLAWALLFSTVVFAMRGPAVEKVSGLGLAAALDYVSRPAFVPPLSESFVERALGPLPSRGGPARSEIRVLVPGGRRPVGTPADRVLVEHDLVSDDQDEAVPIQTLPFSARSSDASATRTSDDPSDCSGDGGTVWYRYTPPKDLGLVANTFGSDHRTALAVYASTADGLSPVEGACDVAESGDALVTLPATAGMTYLFQVSAPLGGGALRFSLDPRGKTTPVSVRTDGSVASVSQWGGSSISSDGRYVAFRSPDADLVSTPPASCEYEGTWSYEFGEPGTTCRHVYVRDRLRGTTIRVDSLPNGEPANSAAWAMAMSGDARFVAFQSDATDLAPNPGNSADLFLKDLRTGDIEMFASPPALDEGAPVASNIEGNLGETLMSVSYDGRFVAFQSSNSFVPQDTNLTWDVYVYDRVSKGTPELISVAWDGGGSDPNIAYQYEPYHGTIGQLETNDLTPSISRDGRYVAFSTQAGNIVPGDTNGVRDMFVRDRLLGVTERVSVASDGTQSLGPTMIRATGMGGSMISDDGRYVVFDALSNLDTEDGRKAQGSNDVFVRDRVAGTTRRIGPSLRAPLPGNALPTGSHLFTGHNPTITGDGRFVVYFSLHTFGTDEVDCNGRPSLLGSECRGDVYVYDMVTDTTFPVTLADDGRDSWGIHPMISADGSVVTYHWTTSDAAGIYGLGALLPETAVRPQMYAYELTEPR